MGAHYGKHSFGTFCHRHSCMFKDLKIEGVNKVQCPPISQKRLDWAKSFLRKRRNKDHTGLMVLAVLSVVLAGDTGEWWLFVFPEH